MANIALLSASKQAYCSLVVCDSLMRDRSFTHCVSKTWTEEEREREGGEREREREREREEEEEAINSRACI